MWEEGDRNTPIGPRNCEATYGGSKYVYAAYYYVDSSSSQITVQQVDLSGCINCLGGAPDTWPRWRNYRTVIGGYVLIGYTPYYVNEWRDQLPHYYNAQFNKYPSARTTLQYEGNQWHGSFTASGPSRTLNFS